MTKRYQNGLIGLDCKPHHHRHVRPNRYRPSAKRRWVIPAMVAITLISLAVIAGAWP